MELAFTNARVVTRDEDFIGSVLVKDGLIAAIDRGAGRVGEDLGGEVLMPGVIDLHTDSLERHFFPRPNIDWNPVSAAVTHDACCLAVGVTTVLNSLTLGSMNPSVARHSENTARLVDGLTAAQDGGMLKGEHLIHWRCETTADDLPDRLARFGDHPLTVLLSMMDHTPGQRQYRNLDRFLSGWRANGMSDEAVDERLTARRAMQARNADPHRKIVAEAARQLDLPLASHDDEDAAQMAEAADLGAEVAEFPVTLEAAEEAHRRGMIVVMGGPNLIRGGSYSGNVPAAELAEAGLLDAFASDYVPRSLIECAFAMGEKHGWDLARSVALVTAAPAKAARLEDRGVLEPGRRADMVRVRQVAGVPVIGGVWSEGRRAA